MLTLPYSLINLKAAVITLCILLCPSQDNVYSIPTCLLMSLRKSLMSEDFTSVTRWRGLPAYRCRCLTQQTLQ